MVGADELPLSTSACFFSRQGLLCEEVFEIAATLESRDGEEAAPLGAALAAAAVERSDRLRHQTLPAISGM